MLKIPEWLFCWIWQALVGEIYPEIRAVAVGYDIKKRELTLIYYLSREPTEYDEESISTVMTNILAHTIDNSVIAKTHEKCIFSKDKLSKLDNLNGFIYSRREYD